MLRVSALYYYPVKSLRGHSVPALELDDYGPVGDRRFLIVTDPEGMFITQRSHPRLALIATELTGGALTLTAPGHGSVTIPPDASAEPRMVVVWRDTVEADDCGDAAAAWLSQIMGQPLRLVRMGARYHRAVRPGRAKPGDVYSFADGTPLLVVGEASLADLNARLALRGEPPLPMNRFRPNLVVAGAEPFAEDAWKTFRAGAIVLRNVDPCARCVMTTTDQFTGERGKEPLRTLATYRRDPREPSDVNFGINAVHETKRGTLRVGDPIELL
jgi:hypothetical protein